MLTSKARRIYAAMSAVTGVNVRRIAREVYGRASWPPEKMEEFRLERLRSVLVHAGANVPYYKGLFRSCGFDPSACAGFGDLTAIPPLTRDAVVHSFEELRDSRAKPGDLMSVSTGGTTGRPVRVLLDKANAIERMLVNHRMYALMGRTLGEPTLLIAGSPIDIAAWRSLRDRLKNRLFNISLRSSFELTPERIKLLVAEMKTGRFAFVIAYASVFDVLASHVEQSRELIQLPCIVPCAELVTQAQRDRWKAAFSTEVYEIYGAREMGSLAGETRDHAGLAVNGDLYHCEVTDCAGRCLPEGQVGLITVTGLLERGMPLIRYQLGDLGALVSGPANSGLPFRRLRITHGRLLDVISCPDGKLLPRGVFPHLMKEVADQVERYQVVQEEVDRLMVKIVRRPGYGEQVTRYLRARIQSQVGSGVRIEFSFPNDIEASASGKYRPTISNVPWERKRIFDESGLGSNSAGTLP